MENVKEGPQKGSVLYDRKYQPDVLNILRVVATLFVFFLHGIDSLDGSKELQGPFSFLIATPAWGGVWIFLFLSGFLFGYGASRGKYPFAGHCRPRDLGRFYLSRFLRFAPLYYAYVIFYEFFSGNFALWNNPKLLLRLLTFTFNGEDGADGLGHLWYISMAMQLYLVMPFLFFLLEKIRKKAALWGTLVGVTVAGLALRLLLYTPMTQEWYREVYTFFACNLDFVCAGILCALLLFRYPGNPKGNVFFKCGATLFFIALAVYNCYIYYYGIITRYVMRMTDTYCFILPTVYIVACSALVLAFSGRERKLCVSGRANAVAAWFFRLINAFAKYSYGFYIFHIAVFAYLRGSLLQVKAVVSAPFAVRYLCFYLTAFALSLGLSLLFLYGPAFKPRKRAAASVSAPAAPAGAGSAAQTSAPSSGEEPRASESGASASESPTSEPPADGKPWG